MKKTVIKFGQRAFFTATILFLLALTLGKNLSYGAQEVIGYSSMAISLVFVFFGIKNYRDQENGGTISFGQALKVGMLITTFAALGFGIIDYIYTAYINPEFVQEYLEHFSKDLENTYSGAELATKKAELNSSMEQMTSGFMAFIMFATVVLIGFVISLISSLILNKK